MDEGESDLAGAQYCARCGQRRADPAAAYCPNCGTRYLDGTPPAPSPSPPGPPAQTPPSPPRPKAKSRNSGSSPLAVAILVVLLIGLSVWFLNNTRPGLELKCRLFNDLGACVESLVIGDAAPNVTHVPPAPTSIATQPSYASEPATPPAPVETASEIDQPAPVGAAVYVCPADYGGGESPGAPAVPATATSPPGPIQLVFYADNYNHVLAFPGWQCHAGEGADGSGDMVLFDAHDPSARIHLQNAPACVGCQLDLVCSLFSSAAQADKEQYGTICQKPPGEQQHHISASLAGFVDPPGVVGTGGDPGGPYSVVGAGYYAPNGGGAAVITCSLAAADRSACDAITADFVATFTR